MEGSTNLPSDLPSLAEALQFVDQLDASVAAMLAPAVGAEEPHHQGGADAAVLAVQPFAKAAGALEKVLVRLKAGATKDGGPQHLQQEVAQLQEELREKDELLMRCQQKIARWQGTCAEMTQTHETNLFQTFT